MAAHRRSAAQARRADADPLPTGASHATVGGTVRGHDSRLFALRARNGSGSSIGDTFIGRLPQSGEYRIDVYLMRNEARRNGVAPFNLDVSLR